MVEALATAMRIGSLFLWPFLGTVAVAIGTVVVTIALGDKEDKG